MECFFAPPTAHFPSAEYGLKKLFLIYVFLSKCLTFICATKKLNNVCMDIVQVAKKFIANNISVIPCNENKACCIPSWSIYTERIMSIDDVELNFQHAKMIAILCGASNGGLEVIDVDLKYAIEPEKLWQQLLTTIEIELPLDFVIVKTINGGYHIYFKSDSTSRNAKLASRYATPEELLAQPHQKTKCFLETRSNGGYVIAPPSQGYSIVKGKLNAIPFLDDTQRTELINICKSFNLVMPTPNYTPAEVSTRQNYLLSPLDDYNKTDRSLEVLLANGWTQKTIRGENVLLTRPGKTNGISASFNTVSKLFYCFTSSTEFEPSRAYMPYQVTAKILYNDNYGEMARQFLAQGYGVPLSAITVDNFKSAKKVYEVEGEKALDDLCNTWGYSAKIASAIIDKVRSNEDVEMKTVFWYKDDDKVKLHPLLFRNFLEQELHITLFYGSESNGVYRVIQNIDSRIREITKAELKENILQWFNHNTAIVSKTDCSISEIINALAGKEIFFSDGSFEWIKRNENELLKDTATTAHYYFNNGIVKVTKDGVKIDNYANGLENKVVWKNQVINKDYFVYDTDQNFNWKTFLFKVCGEDNEKFIYLCSLIGYCLHRYKDDAFAKAVMFAEEVADPKDGGGAGKGILIKALQHVIGGMTVDGESFKPDSNFAFQRYSLGAPFICINDAAKNTQWDKWKSIITDGLTIDVKNKNQLYLPFEDSPKILVTTQYGIDEEKKFLARRFLIFTFEPFFNNKHTPFEEFGEMFFKWTNEQWMLFYNFMFDCVSMYLRNGIVPITSKGLSKKTFTLKYGSDLQPFLESELNESKYILTLYEEFLDAFGIDKNEYKRKLFEDGVKLYCATKDYAVIRDTNNKNKLKIIVTNV